MSDTAKAVFLSYASQDAGAALRIAAALREAGVEVWFDQSELVGGDAWDRKIRQQIQSCALFLPVISAATQSRREGYFRIEWKLAAQRTHAMADGTPFLLPIVIDATRDAEALVPEEFRAVQWTRIAHSTSSGPAGSADSLSTFCERVKRLLAGDTETTGGQGPGLMPALAPSAQSRDDNFWIAVLPFKCRSADADVAALAEGMTEGIVTGLSRFSYLRVIANSSTARFAQEALDIRTTGRELGARYVMEGSLRQSGSKLRVAVQVVDAISGAHVWAENYDRPYSSDAVFDLQDDLVPRITATVADHAGVLLRSMIEIVRRRDPLQLTPHEALLRGFGLHERYAPAEHTVVRDLLERAVEQVPSHADCWSQLAVAYTSEFSDGFNPRPDPLGRAVAAAQRAFGIAPASASAHYSLARSLFFTRNFGAFRVAAERCIALNPLDASSTAFLGCGLAFSGDWVRGCALAKRARELNPHHPPWFWFADTFNAYRQGDYATALETALKINMPGYHWAYVVRAASYAQLGQTDAAAKVVGELLAARPDFAKIGRAEMGKWTVPDLVEHFVDGLRKAGLEMEAPTQR